MAAHEQGIVTSASLMVRWPAAGEAADYARLRPTLSLGLHLDLGEWTYRDGSWTPVYEVLSTQEPDAVVAEVGRQLEMFRQLVGREPTHLDSHQHAHRSEPVRGALLRAARDLRIPLRHFTSTVQYRGDFYGQSGKGDPYPEGITVEALLRILATLPPGFTELGCHPGSKDDVDSMYRCERRQELAALCHSSLWTAIAAHNVELCSFHLLAGTPPDIV
jgi:predicted glycoside hydrolase/deacetylase ChbG (UPF0249 family)